MLDLIEYFKVVILAKSAILEPNSQKEHFQELDEMINTYKRILQKSSIEIPVQNNKVVDLDNIIKEKQHLFKPIEVTLEPIQGTFNLSSVKDVVDKFKKKT